MTQQESQIVCASYTVDNKVNGHCEDPPVGGDEAIFFYPLCTILRTVIGYYYKTNYQISSLIIL